MLRIKDMCGRKSVVNIKHIKVEFTRPEILIFFQAEDEHDIAQNFYLSPGLETVELFSEHPNAVAGVRSDTSNEGGKDLQFKDGHFRFHGSEMYPGTQVNNPVSIIIRNLTFDNCGINVDAVYTDYQASLRIENCILKVRNHYYDEVELKDCYEDGNFVENEWVDFKNRLLKKSAVRFNINRYDFECVNTTFELNQNAQGIALANNNRPPEAPDENYNKDLSKQEFHNNNTVKIENCTFNKLAEDFYMSKPQQLTDTVYQNWHENLTVAIEGNDEILGQLGRLEINNVRVNKVGHFVKQHPAMVNNEASHTRHSNFVGVDTLVGYRNGIRYNFTDNKINNGRFYLPYLGALVRRNVVLDSVPPLYFQNGFFNPRFTVADNAATYHNDTLDYTLNLENASMGSTLIVDVYKSDAEGRMLQWMGESAVTVSSSTVTVQTTMDPLPDNSHIIIATSVLSPAANFGTTCYQRVLFSTKKATPPCETCSSCPGDFAPIPGKEYVFSAWVKDDMALQAGEHSYENTCSVTISFELSDNKTETKTLKPSGSIIDGWQRIHAAFTVPEHACKIGVELNNNSQSDEVYFDDIRIHPFNASLKSFVYDPQTLRLSAELDDNNYATFYEYDEEGALIRVKKETERGVMTIREARQGQQKIAPQPPKGGR
jgi:hypothetical protein